MRKFWYTKILLIRPGPIFPIVLCFHFLKPKTLYSIVISVPFLIIPPKTDFNVCNLILRKMFFYCDITLAEFRNWIWALWSCFFFNFNVWTEYLLFISHLNRKCCFELPCFCNISSRNLYTQSVKKKLYPKGKHFKVCFVLHYLCCVYFW